MKSKAIADRVLKFTRLLKDPKGGKLGKRAPIQWLPWQEQLFVDLFATITEEGSRQYREGFVFMPRKNGKTTTIAACILFQLFMSDEYGQEIYSAANDKDQSGLVFNMCASMIRANPALVKRCRIYDSTKRIVRHDTESIYRALSSESATAHGLNPSFVIYDELHEAKSRALYDVLKTGQGTRDEPLFITITTAGDGNNLNTVCYELYTYAKRLLAGDFEDPRFYALLYEADLEDDIFDPATWFKANPSLGHFRKLDELEDFANRAKNTPTLEPAFRRLYLNQWVQSTVRWMRREDWNACETPRDLWPNLAGRICHAGLDLSSTGDITAFVMVFPTDDGRFYVLPHFWLPESMVNQRRSGGEYLKPWADAGYIEVVPGKVIDYEYVVRRINDYAEVFQIWDIAFDRWGAAALRQTLEGEGFEMIQFGQGFASLSPPMKEVERLVKQEKLVQDGNPVLSWMMGNLLADVDAAGNIKPNKEKSLDKIDGAVAMIMGLERAIAAAGVDTPSIGMIEL